MEIRNGGNCLVSAWFEEKLCRRNIDATSYFASVFCYLQEVIHLFVILFDIINLYLSKQSIQSYKPP